MSLYCRSKEFEFSVQFQGFIVDRDVMEIIYKRKIDILEFTN